MGRHHKHHDKKHENRHSGHAPDHKEPASEEGHLLPDHQPPYPRTEEGHHVSHKNVHHKKHHHKKGFGAWISREERHIEKKISKAGRAIAKSEIVKAAEKSLGQVIKAPGEMAQAYSKGASGFAGIVQYLPFVAAGLIGLVVINSANIGRGVRDIGIGIGEAKKII